MMQLPLRTIDARSKLASSECFWAFLVVPCKKFGSYDASVHSRAWDAALLIGIFFAQVSIDFSLKKDHACCFFRRDYASRRFVPAVRSWKILWVTRRRRRRLNTKSIIRNFTNAVISSQVHSSKILCPVVLPACVPHARFDLVIGEIHLLTCALAARSSQQSLASNTKNLLTKWNLTTSH